MFLIIILMIFASFFMFMNKKQHLHPHFTTMHSWIAIFLILIGLLQVLYCFLYKII